MPPLPEAAVPEFPSLPARPRSLQLAFAIRLQLAAGHRPHRAAILAMAMHGSTIDKNVHNWLDAFELEHTVRLRIAHVVAALPPAVRADLMHDPAFVLCHYDPARGMQVPLPLPPDARSSRCVALKRTLGQRPAAFAHWLIAHELAHAHLRNAGRWEGDDPEHAADALAAAWGFPRPST